MKGEPDHFLDAMRVRVSGPAQRVLLRLRTGSGRSIWSIAPRRRGRRG
ncbi:MAG: hypothetical protein M0C28_32510 [Candidatus Moduliflexus flocculans]|nr:hypothetical protein [Candidatus Moduliflexus flocculans]